MAGHPSKPSSGPGSGSDWIAWSVVGCLGLSLIGMVLVGFVALVLAMVTPNLLGNKLSEQSIRFEAPWLTNAQGYDQAQNQAERLQKPMLVVVYAPWSSASQGFYRRALADTRLINFLQQQSIIPVALNREAGPKEQALGYRWEVTSYPTVLLIEPSGQVRQALAADEAGAMDDDALIDWLKQALASLS